VNLHGIVSGAIGAVNPHVSATLKICTGYTTLPSGKRTPTYAADQPATAQVQDLSQADVRQLDSLNIQGSQKVIYLNGALAGLVRNQNKGGDLVVLGTETWLVTAVLEQWPDWAKVAVTLQVA
jgi:hypothetical protein